MNNYQIKRITGNLKRRERLTQPDSRFLKSLKEHIGEKDYSLSSKENHRLMQIASRIGG